MAGYHALVVGHRPNGRLTYKVLLTRGMLGTMVYSTDPETQDLLRSLIPDSV